jgi:MFS-type transporter involved in bile tolerance (Atg22 family)
VWVVVVVMSCWWLLFTWAKSWRCLNASIGGLTMSAATARVLAALYTEASAARKSAGRLLFLGSQ